MNTKDDFTNSGDGQPNRRLRPLDWVRAEAAEEMVERVMLERVRRRKKTQKIRASALAAILAIGGAFWFGHPDAPPPSVIQRAAFCRDAGCPHTC